MKLPVICPTCNQTFTVKRCQAQKRRYCSRRCMAKGYKTQLTGKANPNYRNGGPYTPRSLTVPLPKCRTCENTVPNHRRGFCNDCFKQYRTPNLVSLCCLYCKKEFRDRECKQRKYCSRRCTDLHKRVTQAGGNSHFWQGGITAETRRLRSSAQYKQWRDAVFARDGYACVVCDRKRKPGDRVELEADHIRSWAEFPELRFEVSNGQTLCKECHKRTLSYGLNLGVGKSFLAIGPNGRAVWIEISKQTLTPEQLERHEELRMAGAVVLVADSIDAFIRQYNEIFHPSDLPY
jgi:5-methylcytosine-specific restriction endonuclease McrA